MSIEEINSLSQNQTIRMRNRDGAFVECRKVYFPLDLTTPTALIELTKSGLGLSDFREVPIYFLFL